MPLEHCEKHEQNTEDITSMKANFKLLTWGLPILVTILGSVVGYVLFQINDSQKLMAVSITEVKGMVQTAVVNDAVYQVRLSNLENDVRSIKGNK